MSSRPYLKPFQVITNGSMATSLTSTVTSIGQISQIGYTISWTGAPVGSFDIQVCNNAQFNSSGAYISGSGSWVSLPLTPAISAAGTADSGYADVIPTSAAFMRLAFTRVSGTGTLNAFVSGKC